MEIINQNRHVRDFAHQITKRKLEFPIRKFYIIPTASNCETYKLNKHQKKKHPHHVPIRQKPHPSIHRYEIGDVHLERLRIDHHISEVERAQKGFYERENVEPVDDVRHFVKASSRRSLSYTTAVRLVTGSWLIPRRKSDL